MWFPFSPAHVTVCLVLERNLVWLVEIDLKAEPGEPPGLTLPGLQNVARDNLASQLEETRPGAWIQAEVLEKLR